MGNVSQRGRRIQIDGKSIGAMLGEAQGSILATVLKNQKILFFGMLGILGLFIREMQGRGYYWG